MILTYRPSPALNRAVSGLQIANHLLLETIAHLNSFVRNEVAAMGHTLAQIRIPTTEQLRDAFDNYVAALSVRGLHAEHASLDSDLAAFEAEHLGQRK